MVIMNSGSTASIVNGTANKTNEECGIKEVYGSNLNEEFDQIRRIVDKFQFIAMDTEFPGVVARPIGEFKSTADYQYQLLRCNVDLLKLIQVGLTFLNEKGDMPTKFTTWQFNFKFSLGEDMYAQDSIDLLTNSGIKFKKHEEDGIDFMDFAELLMTSGLVLSDKVKWISFHSGYDFGYLLKLLTNFQLPADENEFFELLQIYFPAIYDVKYVMKSCRSLKGGLQEVADQLKVDRIGPQHQAGSDSLLTGLTFFRMKQLFFEDSLDDGLYCGHLFGLGAPYGNGADAAAPPVPVLDVGQKMQQQQQQQQQQVNGATPIPGAGPPTAAGASSQSNGVVASSLTAADQSATTSSNVAAAAAASAAAALLVAATTKGAGSAAATAANGLEASGGGGQLSSDGGQAITGGQPLGGSTNTATQPLETMSSSSGGGGGTSRLSATNTKSSSSTSSSGGGGGNTTATNQNQQSATTNNNQSVNINNNNNNNQSVNPNDKDEAATSSLSTNSGNSQDSTDSASETSSNHGGAHSNDAES